MHRFLVAAAATAALLTVSATDASAQSRTKVGVLACNVAPTVGFVIGSRQDIACVFTPNYGRRERYVGAINRVGVDLGATAGGRLVWGVFAQTSALPPRSIAGNYVGASGEASIGIGAGANVLLGGSNRTVSLQPVSLKGQAGVNVGVGVAGLWLR